MKKSIARRRRRLPKICNKNSSSEVHAAKFYGTPTDFKVFVKMCSIVELVIMQNDLRKYPEDKMYLDVALNEVSSRSKKELCPE